MYQASMALMEQKVKQVKKEKLEEKDNQESL